MPRDGRRKAGTRSRRPHPSRNETMSSAGPLLEATALTRHYAVSRGLFRPKGLVRALDGVSFSVDHGKTLAVVGESGCGKSTLARAVTMIEKPTAGELRIAGEDVVSAAPATLKRLRPLVQMVFQNPYASLNPRKKVGTLLEEPLAIGAKLGAEARRDAARAMMARVGLKPQHYGRYPHMFSGGQRQRIAGARARRQRTPLKGELPSPLNPPAGCPFHTRCPHAIERCRVEVPRLEPFGTIRVACIRAAELP